MMKKTLLILFAITLCSCTKDLYEANNRPEDFYEISANAAHDGVTKTSISGLSILWSTGDRIGVYADGFQSNKSFSSNGSSDFKGIFDVVGSSSPSTDYYSYYPYSDKVSCTTISSSLSSNQVAPFDGKADFMVSNVLNEKYDELNPPSLSFQFKNHLFAIVKITVKNTNPTYADETIEKITLFAPGVSLAGSFSVDVSKGCDADAVFSGACQQYVSMVYPKASKPIIGFNEEHTVYAVVKANEDITTIKVVISTDKHEGSIESKSVVSFNRGVLTAIPTVDFGILSNIKDLTLYKYNCGFMGDSITQFWPMLRSSFFSDNNFLGAGISGQKTWEMVARFDKDIIQKNPRTVIILAGTNNIGWYPDTCDVNVIKKHVATMCEMAENAGIKPIVCSILPRRLYNDKVIQANALLKAYANEQSFAYVDYYTEMSINDKIIESYFSDGLHPNTDGFIKMESISLPIIESEIFR